MIWLCRFELAWTEGSENALFTTRNVSLRRADYQATGSKAVAAIITLDSIVMAIGHVLLARLIADSFPMPFLIGLYSLFSTIIYVLGAIFSGLGKLFKLTNYGLIAMAVIDELLLIYTREMPNAIFGHTIPWSTNWLPIGTVQVSIGQLIS